MPDDRLRELVERVGNFHITDRSMRQTHDAVARALHEGSVSESLRVSYLDAVRRYFVGFEREARGHLHDVGRRLTHANQVLFNLAAERAVALKRIEATRGVLAQLDTIEERLPL